MAGTSELPSRMHTDGFRPLTEQGVLAAVQEHMQLLCTTIMSLDSNENSPEGRKVAQLANDAIMSIASWGTKTREECKEEVRRVDFRLHEVLESVPRSIDALSSDEGFHKQTRPAWPPSWQEH